MKNKFKKGQNYQVKEGLKVDNTTPSINSIIEIESARKNRRVTYRMIEGIAPTNSNLHFWNDSEMAENLQLIQ